MKSPNAFEQGVLDVVLIELRRAMKMKAQLHITIDPWLCGPGATIFASPNAAGRTYEIDLKRLDAKRRRTR